MERNEGRKSRTKSAKGTYAVGDERRAKILGVAVEHYAQWGFHASSLARIAKDVGITQGGLLHHFRSKEDLLVSVLEHTDRQDVERFFAKEVDGVAQLFRTLADLAAYNAARPGRTQMFNMLAAEAGQVGHPAHTYFADRYRMVIEKTAGALRTDVERGALKPDTDCEALAAEIAAVMDGLQLQWALAPKSVDMPARLYAYADRLVRSITVDGSGLPERVAGAAGAVGA
ncbi:TetR/AcrR family transcriptional regulator [Streptomyces sp. TRM66268-LWL]|uniref:TetR/AcrR family transcriptional regulator n=1 Tax=Streptomyces polyasparticus TaxID=2767826 RepID=A0ABR7SGX4_9ACTN|nr:TetR/AcrR family transcriptional regulator [Streptomyces polyasparticus]MBC9714740.1 TetR/AcrR family transcriptional regulator [Streptomyces polyasparticus]